MGCKPIGITSDLELNCNDIPLGGIVTVYAARYEDIDGKYTEVDGEITAITPTASSIANLEFNNKDGYSSFEDNKTVDASGVVKTVPAVMLEFPKMTVAKRNALELFTTPNTEYVLFLETAGGVRHAVGLDAGVWGSEANGESGASKDDKNVFNLKFEGEEINLARTVSDAAWTSIVNQLIP